MTNEPTADDQPVNDEPPTNDAAEEPAGTSGPRVLRGTGGSLGGMEGGLDIQGRITQLAEGMRKAARSARDAAEERRPAAEAALRVARDRAEQAMDAARPRIERAVGEVTDYVNEHDDQLRAAVARAARIAANMAVPASLRPMADAVNEELHRQPEAKAESTSESEQQGDDTTEPPAQR